MLYPQNQPKTPFRSAHTEFRRAPSERAKPKPPERPAAPLAGPGTQARHAEACFTCQTRVRRASRAAMRWRLARCQVLQ